MKQYLLFLIEWLENHMSNQKKKFVAQYFFSQLSDTRWVDLQQYTDSLAEIYNHFDEYGYDVVNVIPIHMGASEPCENKGRAYLGEACFTPTRGAVVVGRLRD